MAGSKCGVLVRASLLAIGCALAAGAFAQSGNASRLLGQWNFANPRWEGFVVRPDTLSLGTGECARLPYRVLEEVDGSFYVAADNPKGKCVPLGYEGVFLQLTPTEPEGLHFRGCRSRDALEKLKTAPDHADCSSLYGSRVRSRKAQALEGSWSARAGRDNPDVSYEVDLGHSHERMVGTWSVETRGSTTTGCLSGASDSHPFPFRACTNDGSAGARDRAAVCPTYDPGRNRFVLAGSRLRWDVWDARRQGWRTFASLRRSPVARPLAWSDLQCGRP